jgi:hypothetical protein
MLKIFNECLTVINNCIKGLLEDGLLSVNQDFGDVIEPWQRKALDGIVGDEVTDITGCHLPPFEIHGMPTDAMVVGFQYKKDNVLRWASALVVCNKATQWSNVSVLTAEDAQAGLDEDNHAIGLKYSNIGRVGQMAAEALPPQAA